MDDTTILKLEEARRRVLKCSELITIIDQKNGETESIRTKVEIAEMVENKTRDDVQLMGMAPDRIKHNEDIIDKSLGKLFKTLGI